MSKQQEHETIRSQQENREMIFPCQISQALRPASQQAHSRGRTAGEGAPQAKSPQPLPGASTHTRNAFIFCATTKTKKSHQNKCSSHVFRGQTPK